jgi:glutamate synthase domain-containing protein 1
MCGIAGIVNLNGSPIDQGLLHNMIRILGHRGSDASGNYTDQHVGLAHARLSIIENFMVPKFVDIRDCLPKTSTGKISKRELAIPAGRVQ